MRFCTTCGRNFETSIDICPHDGTPLFGMAGEEDNTAQDELVAEVASVLAGDEREAVASVDAPVAEIPDEPEAFPDPFGDDVAAQEEDDLFGGPLVDPSEDVDSDVGLVAESDPFAISADAGESVADEPSEDLFAADADDGEDDLFGEDGEPSEAEEDFFSESAGLDEDDLFGESSDDSSVADEPSDTSQQIAASIDGLLDEIDEDGGQQPLSMRSSLGSEEVAAVTVPVDDPYEDEPVEKKGSKMPLLIILVLLLGSAAGVYLFSTGSLGNGTPPDPNTPGVVAPTAPAQPAEEAVADENEAAPEEVEPAAEVEEPAAEVEEPAAEVEEPAAVEKKEVVEKPAAAPVKEKPAPEPKPVVAKEKPAVAPKPVKEKSSQPAAEPAKPKKQAPKELTPEELLEQELKRMAP